MCLVTGISLCTTDLVAIESRALGSGGGQTVQTKQVRGSVRSLEEQNPGEKAENEQRGSDFLPTSLLRRGLQFSTFIQTVRMLKIVSRRKRFAQIQTMRVFLMT